MTCRRPTSRLSTPRLGVLDFHPIQYHTPLYQKLAQRGQVRLDVLYFTDHGHRETIDPGFGVPVAWDIDLLSGYCHKFLATCDRSPSSPSQARTLARWIKSHDAIVIHGYSHPYMLFAIAACRTYNIPYLLRGDSGPPANSTGLRLRLRNVVVRLAVVGSADCLAIGRLNEDFYRQYGARHVTFAPYSVDDERFARMPPVRRRELLSQWGLDDKLPVIMFCGKIYAGKRPLDIVAAINLLSRKVNALFVGDGVQAKELRESLTPGSGAITGFVNQKELPAYYHAADILVLPSQAEKWGLVINEAMAAGTFPVASDRVGAVPDLVEGVGEVYPCGDIESLAKALDRALAQIKNPESRDRMRRHASRYSLERTAVAFETAALAASADSKHHRSLATAKDA